MIKDLNNLPDKGKQGLTVGAGMLAVLIFLLLCFGFGSSFMYKKWKKAEEAYNKQQYVLDSAIAVSQERAKEFAKAQAELDSLIAKAEARETIDLDILDSIRNENKNIQHYRTVHNDELVRLFTSYKPN